MCIWHFTHSHTLNPAPGVYFENPEQGLSLYENRVTRKKIAEGPGVDTDPDIPSTHPKHTPRKMPSTCLCRPAGEFENVDFGCED